MGLGLSRAGWERIQAALDDILDQPDAEQLRYLDVKYGADKSLHQEIKTLLGPQHSALDLLEHPAAALIKTLMTTGAETGDSRRRINDRQGDRIGNYRLCEELGRGGMGVVYRAERSSGTFDREVAIKLLWTWHGREGIIERFRREQQLLASLTHPNIAQLYDGGLSENGQPYFVMEYVRGEPLDQYCDRRRLGIGARLRLLLQVANALSFSHSNLIVHRDIKPSNILVTAQGRIKLLDFGIAKLLGEKNDLNLTRTGEQVMTPGFAAPEQLRNSNITVATDVYLLGLVMYELLTGKHPYRDQADSFFELARVKCESPPTAPSIVVDKCVDSVDDDSPARLSNRDISARRGLDIRQLQKRLRGDLDAIVLKCLENSPKRRYASMEAYKADIQRYFDNLPIAAQPPSGSYLAAKFLRRHWRTVSALSLFTALLITYALTATLQAQKIQQTLDRVATEKQKAQQVADFMINIFKGADPNVSGLETITAGELLERGQARVMHELGAAPEIQGYMLTALGEIYFSQGDYPRSTAVLEQALERQRQAGPEDALSLANTTSQLAIAYSTIDRRTEAEALFRESLAIHEALIVAGDAEEGMAYAEVNNAYGVLLWKQGLPERAEQRMTRAIDILRNVATGDAGELGVALNNLANLQSLHGRYAAAERNMREAIRIHEKTLGTRHSYFTMYLNNFGIFLTDIERFEEAERYSRRALTLQHEILGPNHPYVSNTLRALGRLYHRLGRLDEAETLLRQALAINRASLARDNFITAVIQLRLGAVLRDLGHHAEAGEAYADMLQTFDRLAVDDHTRGWGLSHLGSLAHARGDLTQAQAHYARALALLPDTSLRTASAQVGYARVLLDTAHPAAAADHARAALAVRSSKLRQGHGLIAEATGVLGLALNASGDRTAAALLRNAHAVMRDHSLYRFGHRRQLAQQTAATLSAIDNR